MNKNKNLAFTLAEVLIVIGIIGVVAALTLPNLNHETGDKETVTRVKKTYSILTEALDRAQAIYGDFDTWFKNCTPGNWAPGAKIGGERVVEFLKVKKNCKLAANEGCFSSEATKNLVGSSRGTYDDNVNIYKFILSDGVSVAFQWGNNIFTVDIDGPNKGANTFGKDLFNFEVDSSTGMLKAYSDCSDTAFNCSLGGGVGVGFGDSAGWILKYDNVDYLKADRTGQCNDSNIILDGTTNTSCH